MNLAPLLESGWVIQLHAGTAVAGVILGAMQFAMKKGTTVHRTIGWIWMTLIGVTAFGSFFINEIRMLGPFSPIHILSAVTLYSIYESLTAIRVGNVARHKQGVIVIYVFGLIIAGLFTLAPGRILYRVFFGA